ncbi:CARDB domain-containing protein [Natrarchaeobius sp. A-rgal3]|uniref:CARDB domain-containing protein n=1 Tax=Natrarchaeobius versutus TaxID=1679078 RepID=UPI00350FE172
MTHRFAVFAFVVLLVGSLPAGVAGVALDAGGTPSHVVESAAASSDDSEDVLHRTTTLRHLPDQPGTFETEKRFQVPDPVVDLEIGLDSRAEIESVDGFEAVGDATLRWTGETDEPVVRFTMPANRTGDVGHHATDDGRMHDRTGTADGYSFVDTGEWGIVQVPGIDITLRQTESVGHDETVTVDGPGATGGDIAFFGEVVEHRTVFRGETIRLIVPEAADLEEEPADVLETLAYASQRLDVGAAGEETFVVAVPTDADWGPEGLQYGEGDAWVVADASLEDSGNVWIHEYVHVRQGYDDVDSDVPTGTEWLVEAQAEYYAGLLSFERGLIEFDEFSRHLEAGERSPYADGVLVDPNSWDDDRTDYVKGRLVYGEIDRTLRLETDGDRTLVDVFRLMNAHEGSLTETEFLALLEDVGGSETRSVAERYTRTPETPTMWTQRDHGDAFDRQGATFEYGFGDESIDVAGDSWAADYADGETIAVPVDERVTVPVTAENVGDRDGTADATLEVDGEVVDYSHARLAPGERTTERLGWTPTEPGTYDLRVGTERLTVLVRPPSSVAVSDLSVDPETVEPGETVTMTATVESADARPAAASLEVRTYDGVVDRHLVGVDPGESETLETELSFDDEGRYEIAIGDVSTMATVSEASTALEVDSIPGFGVSAALVALVIAAVVGVTDRYRRRSG